MTTMRNRSEITAYLLLVLLILTTATTVIAYNIVTGTWESPCKGEVKTINIDVYWDQGVTRVIEIDWGQLAPGGTITKSMWVIHTGTSESVTLYLTCNNSVPANFFDYASCTWNSEGIELGNDVWRLVDITLEVYTNITGIDAFTFDIILIGEG